MIKNILMLYNLLFIFKPENILLVEDNRVKISDFGFAAKLKEEETLRGRRRMSGLVWLSKLFPPPPPLSGRIRMPGLV